jgi:hypothetical protein
MHQVGGFHRSWCSGFTVMVDIRSIADFSRPSCHRQETDMEATSHSKEGRSHRMSGRTATAFAAVARALLHNPSGLGESHGYFLAQRLV